MTAAAEQGHGVPTQCGGALCPLPRGGQAVPRFLEELKALRLRVTFRPGPLGRFLGGALGANGPLRERHIPVHIHIAADVASSG
jgi:hypothetical protein